MEDTRQRWAEARPILRGLGWMLLAAGVFLVLNGLYIGAAKYRRIRQWVPVQGVVVDSKMMDEHSARVTNNYRAAFTFQFQVQGRQVFASVLHDHSGPYNSEMSDWKNYQPGSQQRIRYDPADPQEITVDDLNVRSFREPLKLLGWGAALTLIGFVFRR
jgi:hypothetical protein